MNYVFYGWETADMAPVCEAYCKIRDPRHLYDILTNICKPESCAPRLRGKWSPQNKTLGQCSITAFLAQDIFGGEVRDIIRPGGGVHCFNDVNGSMFDLTSEQFGGEILNYEDQPIQERTVHFSKQEKLERYNILKTELEETIRRL